MKKIIALVLAIVTIAALAMSASALDPIHYNSNRNNFVTHGASFPLPFNFCGNVIVPSGSISLASWQVALCSENVKASFPKEQEVTQSWVTCKEAITAKEMAAACGACDIAHATVFRQRNVDKAGDLTALNWQTGKKNTTIVLFRAEGAEEWEVLTQGELGEKTVEVALPGAGSYVVAMTW